MLEACVVCGGFVLEAYLYCWSRHERLVRGGIERPLEEAIASCWKRISIQ